MLISKFKNLSQISDKYDVFFVDLWGVIHDGSVAYPGVNQTLEKLKLAGKKVIFLSNAPRRASLAIEGLRRVGVPDDLYDAVVTSGEVVFRRLAEAPAPPLRGGQALTRCLILGPERDAGLLSGLPYTRVMQTQDADFVVVTGFDNDDSTIEEKLPYLKEAIKLNLPLICANPDLAIVRQSGKRALCAGVLAHEYEKMGGRVIQFGKPYPEVYEYALELAGNIDKSRIAAIGDSLETDIKGASNFGIDSYFIPGGIFGEELGIKHGELPEAEKLSRLYRQYDICPTGALPEFIY